MLAPCALLCMQFHLCEFKFIEHPPTQPCINDNKQGNTEVKRHTSVTLYLDYLSHLSCFHFHGKRPWPKSSTGEEMVYLTSTSRLQPMVAEKPERQELEISGHIISTMKRRKKWMNAPAPMLPTCCVYPTAVVASLQPRHFYWICCPQSTIKTILHRCVHRQTWSRKYHIETLAILSCDKLTMKPTIEAMQPQC